MGWRRSISLVRFGLAALYPATATSCLSSPPGQLEPSDADPVEDDAAPPAAPDSGLATELRWEAEDFDELTSIDGVYTWQEQADDGAYPGYSGTGYLVAVPEVEDDNSSGCFATVDTCGARLVYRIEAVAPGDYYLHVQTYAADAGDNSLFYGIDRLPATEIGDGGASLRFINLACGAWTWDSAPTPIQVPDAQEHEINLWMREDGTRLDALVLSTSPDLPGPSGCTCPIANCPPE